MMKKQYSYYIVILLALVALGIIAFNRKSSTLNKRHSNFTLNNPSEIDRIEIAQSGDSLILINDGRQWRLNSYLTARIERVSFLLESMERFEVMSPASKLVKDSVTSHLVKQGKHIQMYDGGNVRKAFYVYYDTTEISGTYMMLEKSGVPFMVRLKGYSGTNIENIFSMNPKSWRDNILFDYTSDEIREIFVSYAEQPACSFHLYRDQENQMVLSNQLTDIPVEQTNFEEIRDYLFFFSNIRCEYPEVPLSEYFISGSPFARLELVLAADEKIDLEGYRLFNKSQDTVYDMNRFVGVVHNKKDTVILDYGELDPIFREIQDFQKK